MQIYKSLFVVCAAAVVLPISAGAVDNPSQAKAREALQKAYKDLETQNCSSQAACRGTESATTVRAREALRAKMAELDATAVTQAAPGFSAIPSTGGQTAKLEESRAAVRSEIIALQEKESAAKPGEQKAAPSPLRGLGSYEPLEAPEMPLSQEKQHKLADLLRKYRADEITPEQYHAERAKIVSGK